MKGSNKTYDRLGHYDAEVVVCSSCILYFRILSNFGYSKMPRKFSAYKVIPYLNKCIQTFLIINSGTNLMAGLLH